MKKLHRMKALIWAMCMMAVMSLVLAVPAFAQDLGTAASGAATTGVGYAVAAAALIIVFTAGYKMLKKVIGG